MPVKQRVGFGDGKSIRQSEDAARCVQCERNKNGDNGPSHDGSVRCESGSIASGGDRAHCTCDVCF